MHGVKAWRGAGHRSIWQRGGRQQIVIKRACKFAAAQRICWRYQTSALKQRRRDGGEAAA